MRGRKKIDHYKRANGSGSVKKLSGNRRKPYAALITSGKEWDEVNLKYKQIQKYIGTYATREEAVTALNEYLISPYDIDVKKVTFSDVYREWSSRYFDELKSDGNKRQIVSSFNYSSALHQRPFESITIVEMRDCINRASWNGRVASPTIQSRMKSLYNLMYDFAVEARIVDVNIARQFTLKNIQGKIDKTRKVKVPISPEDEEKLWSNVDHGYTRMILIGIYTGFRPHELCVIERKNVNLEENYIIGGEKTEAGQDRYVPIHPKIKPLVNYYFENSVNKEYLINALDGLNDSTMTYDKYRHRFESALEYAGIDKKKYSPHCTRHTFITRAKEVKVEDEAIKLIVGHSFNSDITTAVYDHSDKHPYLQEQILLLK